MTECGAELKIYDEIGGWDDTITCQLEKGHPGEHEGTHRWQTDEQLMAAFNLANKRAKAGKRKPSPTSKGAPSPKE